MQFQRNWRASHTRWAHFLAFPRIFLGLFAVLFTLIRGSEAYAVTFCSDVLPAEIVTQAAALKNDPDLIYEYVYNNIQTLPIHGSLKGALGTLLDGSGTETDQAELMASLLYAAGHTTAQYQTGTISIDAAHLTAWLGTDNSTYSAHQTLANGGFNVTPVTDMSGNLLYVQVPWTWVRVQIAGTNYVFDPAGKRVNGYDRTVGISNLASNALGYSQSTFLNAATSGATITDRTVAGLNRTAVRSNLASYAQNLVNYIASNTPQASTADIIGGTEIEPLAIGTHQRITASTGFTYRVGSADNRSCLPNSLRTTLKLKLPSTTAVTFNTSDIYGRRLSLFFDSGLHPVLRLDGVVQSTGVAATAGSTVTLETTITHNAYASTFANVTNDTSLKVTANTNGSFVISNGWGPVARGMVEKHRLLLQQNSALNPGSSDAEPVLGESLVMLGYTWLAQAAQNAAIRDEIASTTLVNHHAVGIVGIRPVGDETGPYVDLPINGFSVTQRIARPSGLMTPSESAAFFAHQQMNSALESGTIEQTQPGAVAVSTAKLIDMASQNTTIYDLNNNLVSGDDCTYYKNTARALLQSTYDPADLAQIDSLVGYNAGTMVCSTTTNRVVLPLIGNVTVNGLWTGVGYYRLAQSGDSIGYLITGGLNGGYSASKILNSKMNSNNKVTVQPPASSKSATVPGVSKLSISKVAGVIADPLNRVTGSFTYSNDDLTIGSAGYPWGLSFQRLYDSDAYLKPSPLGLGWTHNSSVKAEQGSDGFEGLAINSPVSGASAIAALYVAQDILNLVANNEKPLDRVVIANQVLAWLMEQLTNNVVSVTEPGNVASFVLLPDGTYNASFGSTDRLTSASGMYTLTRKDGTIITFNNAAGVAPGEIATWHSPAGPTVSYTYNAGGYLTSVASGSGASGTNRTLTLNYNGSNQLTSVSDGTGRSVSYSYDASGNMTAYTDPLGNVSTYTYDASNPGRMTKYFHPSSPGTAFITNTYDDLGRVISQTDASGRTTNVYFAGTRTEMRDALGNAEVFYFSARGKELVNIDALGNQTISTYDGLDRLLTTTFPEENSVSYVYATNINPWADNIATVTYTAKPSSGLSPISQTFTYDAAWNKVATATDGLGLITQNIYDGVTGNLVRTIADYGAGSHFNATSIFTYNARGQVLTATDSAGTVTQYAYDDFGNQISVTRDVGTDHLNQLTTLAYDSVGNVISITDPNNNTTNNAYDSGRRLTSVTEPPVASAPGRIATAFTYDADGRLLQTQVTADAGVLSTTSSTYTPVGQVATTTDPKGNVTRYAYDAADRLSSVTDAVGNVTTYAYDANGNQTSVFNTAIQMAALVQQSYTDNGLLASIRDANNNATNFTYDGFDRLAITTYPGSSTETLTYDTDSNITKRVTRKGDSISFAYDTLNRLCTKTIAASPIACSTTSSGNPTTWFIYDSLGNLTGVRDNGSSIANAVPPSGGSVSYTANYSYDSFNRPVGGNWTPVPTQTTPTASSVTIGHSYDQNDRRVSQTATDNSWWSYPTTASGTGYTANNLNQYTCVGGLPGCTGGVTPTYDGNGNITSDGSFVYCYDAESRLTGIVTGTCGSPTTTIATYAYDAQGRRKSKTVSGVTTIYVTDADNREVLEYNGSTGAIQNWYAFGLGPDEVLNRMNVTGGTRQTAIPDIQGSIVGTLDSGGTLTKTGYRTYGENPNLTSGSNQYTARRFDPETAGSTYEPSGLYYYRARMYSPTLGRFLQPDPIGYAGGANLYAYVRNDPLNLVDPNGLAAEHVKDATNGASGGGGGGGGGGGWGYEPEPGLGDGGIIVDIITGGGIGKAIISGIGKITTKFVGRSLDDLSRAAARPDRNGLTAAGRALQKHGDRPGSAFPRTTGGPRSLNPAGQNIADDILTTPGSITKPNRLGGFDVIAPDGRGLRYNADGSFRNFLEPFQ